MTDTKKLKAQIFAQELVKKIISETKDPELITKYVNLILIEKGMLPVTKDGVEKFINQIEQGINSIVDGMLKSIGQSLDENEDLREKKRKKLFDKNSPQNHLRFCEVLVDKEAQGVI